jgi:hypothetical protein
MSSVPARPGRPLEPVTAVCAAMYYADLVPAYAYVFRIASTDSRFTVYTADPDRYLIGATYTLTLAEPDDWPLSLNAEDWELLAHCLELVAERWGEAVEQADAGAGPDNEEAPAAGPQSRARRVGAHRAGRHDQRRAHPDRVPGNGADVPRRTRSGAAAAPPRQSTPATDRPEYRPRPGWRAVMIREPGGDMPPQAVETPYCRTCRHALNVHISPTGR